ncbi:MAG: prenyltransferase/squalene oxidase repeat-containing protein [Promethearchaeota archaeon]
MKNSKYIFLLISCCISFAFISSSPYVITTPNSSYELFDSSTLSQALNVKKNNFTEKTYFPEYYQSSIHSTYYALYILEAIGKFDNIDIEAYSTYFLSFYDEGSQRFIDEYALRYLDMDPLFAYYPYTSLLEINCYAVLSLGLLNSLHLIDISEMIDFIWSCYNPNSGGFLGQPYSPTLPQEFQVSTADNTYYAVKTLDLLMDSWDDNLSEKDSIITFLNSLQSTNSYKGHFGGFYNDLDDNLSTSRITEPNILSSYYCIKSLELFNLISTVRIPDFHLFLSHAYNDQFHYFEMRYGWIINNSNLVATSMGLELAEITRFSNVSRENVVEFILTNRNEFGVWNVATKSGYHELSPIYLITRSLYNVGELQPLPLNDLTMIENCLLQLYRGYDGGFTLLSEDYTSLKTTNSIVNSFSSFNKISDLSIPDLYNQIEECVLYDYTHSDSFRGFKAFINDKDGYSVSTYPIEYYNFGNNTLIKRLSTQYSHKSLFFGLNTLRKLYKLDDFDAKYDLLPIIDEVLEAQFLLDGDPNNGAFLPHFDCNLWPIEYQQKSMFLEYSYYAIRSLTLLTNYLGIDLVIDTDLNINALKSYIMRNIVETETTLYYDPGYSDNPTTILQNTYYMVYILQQIGQYTLDTAKLSSFMLNTLDYSNVLTLYYSYKLGNQLDYQFKFNFQEVQNLFEQSFSPTFYDFFVSPSHELIDQEVFGFICEMLNFLPYYIESSLQNKDSILLKTSFPLALVLIIIPGGIYFLSTKQLHKTRRKRTL